MLGKKGLHGLGIGGWGWYHLVDICWVNGGSEEPNGDFLVKRGGDGVLVEAVGC